MAKDKVQSSNKSMKISARGQILKRKQTNSKKYNVTQKVLKKYNLRVKPCPLRQYLIQKQKTGNCKALQNETSGNNKIGVPSPKAHVKRLCRRKLHKGTQTDISMTFATGNILEEHDIVASCSKGQHEQCAIKKEPGNIQVITGADRKNTGSTDSLIQAIPSTSTAKPHSLPEISATVSPKRSVCVMTDAVITVQKAVAATQALRVPQRNAAVMSEKIITHDKTVSARLPLTPPKCNVAVMTDIVDEKIGNKSKQASKHGKRSAAKTSRKGDDIILISNASTSDTGVPQKKDVGVMTDGCVKICLHAHEILDDLPDLMALD
ncbi:uncharacterized protein LOC126299479 [Schistocerca gregaria]|uniref:uncharacterized protein LOC126299479 n=1 Tax=Schistocerca gregaria TaxID=7010 RepID=UPI00211E85B0|nr:uncharacterized protein LOC126299479 [Schistocerca gregaria]